MPSSHCANTASTQLPRRPHTAGQQPALTPPSLLHHAAPMPSSRRHHAAPMPSSRRPHAAPTPPQRCCNAAPTPSIHRHNAAATPLQRHPHAAVQKMGGGGFGENTHKFEKNAKMLEKINTIILRSRHVILAASCLLYLMYLPIQCQSTLQPCCCNELHSL